MADIRLATWNLNGAQGARAARLGELLSQASPAIDLVLVQEANPVGMERFRDAAGLDWFVTTEELFADLLRVRGRDGADSGRRPRCVAIAGRGEPPRGVLTFPDVPLPEKVLAGWLDIGGRAVTVVSYHAPTGVQHKEKKPAQAVRMAEWLREITGPVIFAGDFNTPEKDAVDSAAMKTHWHTGDSHLHGAPGDDLLVGPNHVHPLRDALRAWFDRNPSDLAGIAPDGPLAVSHRTGPKRNPRRYDMVFVSPDFSVSSRPQYLYEEAREAGTDRALVIADLKLVTP